MENIRKNFQPEYKSSQDNNFSASPSVFSPPVCTIINWHPKGEHANSILQVNGTVIVAGELRSGQGNNSVAVFDCTHCSGDLSSTKWPLFSELQFRPNVNGCMTLPARRRSNLLSLRPALLRLFRKEKA